MRKDVVDLIEAVRGLGLTPTGEDGPRCIRIDGDAKAFPERLLAVAKALEAVDAKGGIAAAEENVDLVKLKSAIDGVFRWIKLQGLKTDEPFDIIAQALGGTPRSKGKKLDTMPVFAMSYRPKKKWKPQISLGRRLEDTKAPETLEEHRDQAAKMGEVLEKMGAAAPVLRERKEEPEPIENRLW